MGRGDVEEKEVVDVKPNTEKNKRKSEKLRENLEKNQKNSMIFRNF